MASPRIQAGSTVSTNSDSLLAKGGVSFDVQSVLLEIATRFLYLIEGVVVLVIGLLLIRLVRRYFQKIESMYDSQRMALNLMEKLTAGFLAVVTITLALKVVGLDITLLVSALTLGLSFALGDIIKNYVSGILILFKSPFSIGNVVKIRNYTGKVERIDFQSTTLKTFDKKEVTIYNKDILSRSIVNYSKEEERRLTIAVTLGRGTDTQRALAIFEAILKQNPLILKTPQFSIIFRKFSSEGMSFHIRFWVNRSVNILQVRSQIALEIEQAFDEAQVISPHGRQIQFNGDFSMNEDRKHRIQTFYGQPMLAQIATQTSGQVQAVVASEGIIDQEEPESGESGGGEE
jgi:small-conductance mechanosensitive channel